MSVLTPFNFEGQAIRIVLRDGEPWFVAADVCRALDIANATQAVGGLDDDEKTTLSNTEGRAGHGAQSFNIISEPGLYALIMRSRKPEARRFDRWVRHEVLPTLRRTGRYEMAPPAAGEIDDLGPLDVLSLKVRMVSLANKLGGPAAGRHLWQRLGLPELLVAPKEKSASERVLAAIRRADVISRASLYRHVKGSMTNAQLDDVINTRSPLARSWPRSGALGAVVGRRRSTRLTDSSAEQKKHDDTTNCWQN
jgi:hypothetical protein